MDSLTIKTDESLNHPINIYKIYTYPEINGFWDIKLTEFYNSLSHDAKVARFNTAFDSVEDLSSAHKKSLFGTDGKTVSLVALDPLEDKIVAHAQRYIVKKSEKRLQEVAVATLSDEKYRRKGIAISLLDNLIEDALNYDVEFLEFYTNTNNQPINKLNHQLIKKHSFKNIEISDTKNEGWSYLYMYIGDDFSKETIETKIDLEKLKNTLVGDYILTPDAQQIRRNSALSPLAVKNIDQLILERAQGLFLLAYFEELYNKIHPRKSKKNKTVNEPRRRSFWIMDKLLKL